MCRMSVQTEPRGERGIALVIVLLVLLLCAILALEIKSTAALHMRLAKSKRDDFLMRQVMRGHLEILKQVLLADQEENSLETLDDRWLDEKYTALQKLSGEDREEGKPVSSEEFEVTARIEDEARKFNLHNLSIEDDGLRAHWEEVFLRLLTYYREAHSAHGLSRSEADELLRNLKEWLERPDDPQGIPRPATGDERRILVTPDELLMVEGFTREILYDLPPDEEGEESPPGLLRYLTLWSAGPVNLNTAEPPVVHALFEPGDRELADRFLTWREEAAEDQPDTADPDDPVSNALSGPGDLLGIDGFDDEAIQRNHLNGSTVTGRGTRFSVHLFGESEDGLVRQERYVLERNRAGFVTLLFEDRNDPVHREEEED